MKLSVVVPFYNVEHYIHDCLVSMGRQGMADFEVILVDDGSQDGSRAVAEEYVARDDRFRIVTQENQGLGPARNTGMREARGEYLTFVDSDDVVPRDAWQLMVDRLDGSGADFAAGNALRFNSDGVRQSFTHTEPFAADRAGTTIRDFPALAHDRMVWNKVYRRTFWERHGFEFPPIMYEDYPVTLRAHLVAGSVEVLRDPVLLWRERDAGEQSITQRVFEPGNIADRVASALMVLDVLDTHDVPAPVRETVQHHLLGTDVGAVARAVALSVGTPHFDAVLADARRLVDALDTDVIARRTRQERLRIDLVRLGEGDALRHLVDIQDELEPPLASVRREGEPLVALQPQVADADPGFERLPAATRRLAEDDLQLVASVATARWQGDDLHLRVQGRITFTGPVAGCSVAAWLRHHGSGELLRVEVRPGLMTEGPTVTADLVVPGPALLAAAGGGWSTWTLHLELDTGDLRRSAPVGGVLRGAAPFAGVWQADDWHLVMAGRQGASYTLITAAPQHRITAIGPGFGAELKVHGVSRRQLPIEGALLQLGSGAQALLHPLSVDPGDQIRWEAHVQLSALTDPGLYDDLVPEIRSFPVHLVAGGPREAMHVDPGVPLARFAHGSREVQAGGGRFLGAHAYESGPQFLLEEAGAAGHRLRLAGRWLGERTDEARLVLTWHHDLGRPEELSLPAPTTDGRFEVSVDATDLVERMRKVGAPSVGPHPAWSLALLTPQGRYPAHLAPGLVRALPVAVETPDATVGLTCHLELAGRLTVTGLSGRAAGP